MASTETNSVHAKEIQPPARWKLVDENVRQEVTNNKASQRNNKFLKITHLQAFRKAK
jgi:hypothetical protein